MLTKVCAVLNILGGCLQMVGAIVAYYMVKQNVSLNPEKHSYSLNSDNDPNGKGLTDRLEEWINESLNKKVMSGKVGYILVMSGLGLCTISAILSIYVKGN